MLIFACFVWRRPSVYAELERNGIETPRHKLLDRDSDTRELAGVCLQCLQSLIFSTFYFAYSRNWRGLESLDGTMVLVHLSAAILSGCSLKANSMRQGRKKEGHSDDPVLICVYVFRYSRNCTHLCSLSNDRNPVGAALESILILFFPGISLFLSLHVPCRSWGHWRLWFHFHWWWRLCQAFCWEAFWCRRPQCIHLLSTLCWWWKSTAFQKSEDKHGSLNCKLHDSSRWMYIPAHRLNRFTTHSCGSYPPLLINTAMASSFTDQLSLFACSM